MAEYLRPLLHALRSHYNVYKTPSGYAGEKDQGDETQKKKRNRPTAALPV